MEDVTEQRRLRRIGWSLMAVGIAVAPLLYATLGHDASGGEVAGQMFAVFAIILAIGYGLTRRRAAWRSRMIVALGVLAIIWSGCAIFNQHAQAVDTKLAAENLKNATLGKTGPSQSSFVRIPLVPFSERLRSTDGEISLLNAVANEIRAERTEQIQIAAQMHPVFSRKF